MRNPICILAMVHTKSVYEFLQTAISFISVKLRQNTIDQEELNCSIIKTRFVLLSCNGLEFDF